MWARGEAALTRRDAPVDALGLYRNVPEFVEAQEQWPRKVGLRDVGLLVGAVVVRGAASLRRFTHEISGHAHISQLVVACPAYHAGDHRFESGWG